jgi:signal transduction histidine kinase
MEKIRNLSLRKTIVLYLFVALLISYFLSAVIIHVAKRVQYQIWSEYVVPNGNVYEGMLISNVQMTVGDAVIFELCDFLDTWTILLFSILASTVSVILFYQNKIKQPLLELTKASQMISQNELNVSIEYKNRDEMGLFCAEFKRMSAQLYKNNIELWKTLDQEKALRAAISHDIRTPLTVLKGYQELLLEYVPADQLDKEKILKILDAGMVQIDRLHDFVETMRKLKSLEERSTCYEQVSLMKLVEQLSGMLAIMSKTTNVHYTLEHKGNTTAHIFADSAMICEVVENLLSNALRYAKKQVWVQIEHNGNLLEVSVLDDGVGFREGMEKVTAAYYHSNPGEEHNHWGLGLYICRLYCEKHGGRLVLSNQKQGGACAKAIFQEKGK